VNQTEPGPTVLLATGSEVLDAELAVRPSFRIGGQVLYREAVVGKATRSGAVVVVLACSLSGSTDLPQVIYNLRRLDIRVILLAGDPENTDGGLLSQAVGLGVYDLLFDPVRPDEVARAILQPAGFAGAAVWLDGNGDQAVRPAAPAPVVVPERRKGVVQGLGRRLWRSAAPRAAEERTGPDPDCIVAETCEVYRAQVPTVPGRLIAFASPRDGVGRSFLAAALGIWLAGQQEAVALVDLDGGPGRTGSVWNCGIARKGRGETLLTHPSGLRIVREGAGDGPSGRLVTVELVGGLAASFQTVIVTLPGAGQEGTLAVLTGAARIFLVATPERGVLYDVQRELYHYRHLGLDPAVVQLVLNRLGRRAKFRLGEVGGLLPLALCTIVPEAGMTPEEALRGRRFRRCMEDLGRAIVPGSPGGLAGRAAGAKPARSAGRRGERSSCHFLDNC